MSGGDNLSDAAKHQIDTYIRSRENDALTIPERLAIEAYLRTRIYGLVALVLVAIVAFLTIMGNSAVATASAKAENVLASAREQAALAASNAVDLKLQGMEQAIQMSFSHLSSVMQDSMKNAQGVSNEAVKASQDLKGAIGELNAVHEQATRLLTDTRADAEKTKAEIEKTKGRLESAINDEKDKLAVSVFDLMRAEGIIGQLSRTLLDFPVGSVIAYSGNCESPDTIAQLRKNRWLLCDGNLHDTGTAPELLDLYNTLPPNQRTAQATTFRTPDYRGRFLRGVDGSSGNDMGADERRDDLAIQNKYTGVGSVQSAATGAPSAGGLTALNGRHSHSVTEKIAHGGHPGERKGFAGTNTYSPFDNAPGTYTAVTDMEEGHSHALAYDKETRPENISVYWIIKF